MVGDSMIQTLEVEPMLAVFHGPAQQSARLSLERSSA